MCGVLGIRFVRAKFTLSTGMLDQNGFERQVQRMMQHADEHQCMLCYIRIEFDQAELVSSEAARDLDSLMRAHAGRDGLAASLERGTFVLMKPVKVLEDAVHLSDALRVRLAAKTKMTASFGVALRSPDEPLIRAVMRSDEALYLSKRNGGNQVNSQIDTSVTKLRAISAHMRDDHEQASRTGTQDDPA